MPRGLQQKVLARQNKMICAAVKLFLENGYEKTTTGAIATAAGMAPSSFFSAFENKEAILLSIVKRMFSWQFSTADALIGGNADPLLLYAAETALQLHIAELSEALREIYVMAYSLPTTSEYIYKNMIGRIKQSFSPYLPDAYEKDFYEMEIASAGITRSFMAKHCDLYFPINRKIQRCLQCCFMIYHVPQETQETTFEAVLQMQLRAMAETVIAKTALLAEERLSSMMGD